MDEGCVAATSATTRTASSSHAYFTLRLCRPVSTVSLLVPSLISRILGSSVCFQPSAVQRERACVRVCVSGTVSGSRSQRAPLSVTFAAAERAQTCWTWSRVVILPVQELKRYVCPLRSFVREIQSGVTFSFLKSKNSSDGSEFLGVIVLFKSLSFYLFFSLFLCFSGALPIHFKVPLSANLAFFCVFFFFYLP